MIRSFLAALILLPASLIAQPFNDACTNATGIACGEVASGTTVNATDDNTAPTCVTGVTAPGAWYAFNGNGQQVTATTCPDNQYDTKLNVYTGACDALVCVAGNDDIADGVYCSSATFLAESGVTYLILVQGYDGETGPFDLSMTCLSCGAPLNLAALQVLDVSATIDWTSTNSGSTFTIEYGPAGFAQGTGSTLNGTVGVDGPPVTVNGLAPATDYDVYVRETCGATQGPWAGPLSITTLTDPPAVNAFCTGALPLACGSEVVGDTETGLIASAPSCAAANISARGLWYAFTGNGDDATLSTCLNSGYDTKLSVFTGGCGSLVCVAGNDDGPNCPGNTSEVTFQTAVGTNYLVLVHGYGEDAGDFTLRLLCTPACAPVDNDVCGDASLISLQPVGGCESSTGTTVCAFGTPAPNPPCDPYANIVDAWYAFNSSWATGLSLIIEPGTASIVNAAVYMDCSEPAYVECWTEVNGAIDISDLPPNTDFLVRVWNGGGAEAGTFSICVEGNFNVGVSEALRSAERIWPVPASESIFFQRDLAFRNYRVFDVQGRAVLKGNARDIRNGSISIGALEPGHYVLLLDEELIGRFVKE